MINRENGGPVRASGWAVPAATDIAFAIGVLALLGRSIPSNVRIFLLAVAIIDDVIDLLWWPRSARISGGMCPSTLLFNIACSASLRLVNPAGPWRSAEATCESKRTALSRTRGAIIFHVGKLIANLLVQDCFATISRLLEDHADLPPISPSDPPPPCARVPSRWKF